MKKLSILILTLMISFNSFGEWVEVNENVGGTYHIDFDTLKIVDDSVYVWSMRDMPSPNKFGTLSMLAYSEEDCEMLRSKLLTIFFYNQNMGEGEIISSTNITNPEWEFNPPESVGRDATQIICYMAEGLKISDQELKNRINSWKDYYQE